MAIASGTRLGPYEILGVLGIGGMGEVYGAHDSRLHRHVAIKVLPQVMASDPERIARAPVACRSCGWDRASRDHGR